MKALNLILAIALLPVLAFSQEIIDDSIFVTSHDYEMEVGDDLIIGYPSGNDGDFLFVSNDTKKKLGLASKIAGAAASVGSGAVAVGVGTGSLGTIRTGVGVARTAGTVSDVTGAGEVLLKGEHELTGQTVRILRFEKSGNKRRGEHYYAIVAGSGKSNFKIEIEPALNNKEVAGKNNELFKDFH